MDSEDVYHIHCDGPDASVNKYIFLAAFDYAVRSLYRVTAFAIPQEPLVIEVYYDSTYRDVLGVIKLLYAAQYDIPMTMMDTVDRAFG